MNGALRADGVQQGVVLCASQCGLGLTLALSLVLVGCGDERVARLRCDGAQLLINDEPFTDTTCDDAVAGAEVSIFRTRRLYDERSAAGGKGSDSKRAAGSYVCAAACGPAQLDCCAAGPAPSKAAALSCEGSTLLLGDDPFSAAACFAALACAGVERDDQSLWDCDQAVTADAFSVDASAVDVACAGRCGTQALDCCPRNTTSSADDWTRVALRSGAACGLHADGALECWGMVAGEPVHSPDAGDYVDFDLDAVFVDDVASEFACAVASSGAVECWMLDGSAYRDLAAVPAGDYLELELDGPGSGCALLADGAATCWGAEPRVVVGPFQQLVSDGAKCALSSEGVVTCWGASIAGEVELAGTFVKLTSGPCAIDDGSAMTCVAPDGSTTLAQHRFRDFERGCGPNADTGRLECNDLRDPRLEFAPDAELAQVSFSDGRACAVQSDGALLCWTTGFQPGDSAPRVDCPNADIFCVP